MKEFFQCGYIASIAVATGSTAKRFDLPETRAILIYYKLRIGDRPQVHHVYIGAFAVMFMLKLVGCVI